MIIENPDAFKSWLTSILEPLCDADPAALAKYVYALVKKDKPLEELRDGMLDQLDVFLQQETKPFVDMLFRALESHEYLKPAAEAELPSPPPDDQEVKAEVAEAETNGNGTISQPVAERLRARSPGAQAAIAPSNEPRDGRDTRDVQRHRVVVARNCRPHPPPHHEQTLTKVLPLTQLLEEPVDQPPRRRDRRGEVVRDKEERRRRQSRSWERRARTRRHARDEHNAEPRRYDKRSPSPRGRYRNRSPPPANMERPASRSKSRSPTRDREHERERDRLRVPRELERDRMSRDREHRERISRSRDRDRSRERSLNRSLSPMPDSRLDHIDPYKRRCRDFDVKGYCMRGDLCEWDHGVDPVVLEDAALTRVLIPPPPVPEYNPQAPDIWCGTGFAAFGPPLALPPPAHPPHAHAPRELVPIPRVRHEPPISVMPINPPRHPPPMKKNFDYNRLGPARPPLPANAAKCSLEVKKVPRGLNDITHLNNHFSKFGKIVNIQVCFEGDPEGALITFSNPTEASVAYKSTEAVLNNRFIKVFWHNPENKQENTAPPNQQPAKPSDRQSAQHPMSHNKVLINRQNMKATADTKLTRENADREKQAAKDGNATTNGQTEATPAAKRAGGAVLDMHRRAQELLHTQLRQQRTLIQRLEDGNVTEAQKATLMEAINAAQEGIEKLRKELVAYNGMLRQMQVNSKRPKTAVEAQKEILDAELDYITKQQEGQDVTELAKRIAEMRRQMAAQFPAHPAAARRPHSRGGRFNPATRFSRAAAAKAFSVNQSVDHRPRAVLISGFEPEELDSLIAHFSQFGEVTGKEVNLAVPELVLQFKARAQAEQALLRAKHYNDRTLSITWVTNNKPLASTVAPPALNGDSAQEEHKETTEAQSVGAAADAEAAEALARFDEEEEDDPDEERSWRR